MEFSASLDEIAAAAIEKSVSRGDEGEDEARERRREGH